MLSADIGNGREARLRPEGILGDVLSARESQPTGWRQGQYGSLNLGAGPCAAAG